LRNSRNSKPRKVCNKVTRSLQQKIHILKLKVKIKKFPAVH
jgi:hypothetical protein